MNDLTLNHINFGKLKRIGSSSASVADKTYFISYTTLVGIKTKFGWKFTDRKYSVTTSKQVNKFMQENGGEKIPHEDFVELFESGE